MKSRLFFFPILLLLVACVPKKKYDATLDELTKAKGEIDSLTKERDEIKSQISGLEDQIASLTREKDGLAADLERLKKEKGLSDEEVELLKKDLKTTAKELEELRKQRAEAEKRLEAFRALNAKFQKMIDSGKIKVKFRNGQMLVELPAGILFPSGKSTLSKEGQESLTEVAAILAEFPDRRFIIAGHTDNVGGENYNWDLSAARALTVTKFFIKNGVKAKNLSAAGFGEFDPIADNSTEEGKQQNRRIEIILVPNLEELPSLPTEDQ